MKTVALYFALFFSCFVTIIANHNPANIKYFNEKIAEYQKLVQEESFPLAYHVLNGLDTRFRSWTELNSWWADYYFSMGKRAYQQQKYQETISHFERSLAYLPDNISLRRQLGYAYLNNKNYYDAILQFEQIRDKLTEPDKLQLSLEVARCYVLLENYAAAINEFKNLSYNYPDNIDFLADLSLAQMKYQDYYGAVESLERLQKQQVLSPALEQLLQQARKSIELQQSYASGISAHFRIIMENQEFSEHISTILEILDEAYMILGHRFDYSPRHHTKVMFLNRNDFAELTGANNYVLGIHSGSANEIHVPIDRINNFSNPKDLKNTLFHEYCHHLLFLKTQSNPSIPLWFHEGTAQLVEPEKDLEMITTILQRLVSKQKLYDGKSIPFGFSGPPPTEFYAQALSIVYLIDKSGWLDDLIYALPQLRGSIGFDDIFKRISKQTVTEFIDYWQSWLTATLTEVNNGNIWN